MTAHRSAATRISRVAAVLMMGVALAACTAQTVTPSTAPSVTTATVAAKTGAAFPTPHDVTVLAYSNIVWSTGQSMPPGFPTTDTCQQLFGTPADILAAIGLPSPTQMVWRPDTTFPDGRLHSVSTVPLTCIFGHAGGQDAPGDIWGYFTIVRGDPGYICGTKPETKTSICGDTLRNGVQAHMQVGAKMATGYVFPAYTDQAAATRWLTDVAEHVK